MLPVHLPLVDAVAEDRGSRRAQAILLIGPVSLRITSEQTIRPAIWRRLKILRVWQSHHSSAPTSAGWRAFECVRDASQALISQTVRLRASPIRPGEFICLDGARTGHSGQSIVLRVSHTPLAMQRACHAAQAMPRFDRSRRPVRHPSTVPAVQASASGVPNFGSRFLSVVSSPIRLVERRR